MHQGIYYRSDLGHRWRKLVRIQISASVTGSSFHSLSLHPVSFLRGGVSWYWEDIWSAK